MPLDACTIVSKNYLPFARVLARSFADSHPAGHFFVLLYDRNEGFIDDSDEPFELLEVEQLKIPERAGFLFKYTVLEGNTAAKPYFLEHLFEHHGVERLLYIDPDIWISGDLGELDRLLGEHQVVLTPHLDQPIEDDAHPGEQSILQSGTYNLGFIGLRHSDETRRLLRWWQERLWDQCVVRIDQGLFVDQKWIDLVPGLFSGVHILRDPGYNVAYWNLHGRRVSLDGEVAQVNGRPLIFFHFSGIQPDALQHVSKHQDRFTLDQIGEAAELYRRYRDRLFAEGWADCKGWPFAFARFDNGVRIPPAARRLYLALDEQRRRHFGNPFATDSADSFFAWLTAPAGTRKARPPYLSRLLSHLWASRPDLHADFPDPERASLAEFSSWLRDYGRYELGLDEPLLSGLHRESRASLLTAAGLKRRLRNRAKRAWRSPLAISGKGRLKTLLGAERSRALKRWLRPKRAVAEATGQPGCAPRRAPLPRRLDHPGINLVGYLEAETGMGEAARGLARALDTTTIPFSLHKLDLGVVARQQDLSIAASSSDLPYDINLLVVNADQVGPVTTRLGGEVLGGRFNIGYWLWEMEEFPRRWARAFDPLHEVWSASVYCVDAIGSAAPIPVRRLPLPIEAPADLEVDSSAHRQHFGLSPSTFVVLYMFNFLSHFERKNPLALVRAFRRAFSPDNDVQLLLKTSQASFATAAHQRLVEATKGASIHLLDDYLDRADTWRLLATADAYASPHRAEGFGLTLVEAMALGKPVVAAPYSGVRDFFDLNDGFPVRYRRVELATDQGPYQAGSKWAEIDEGHLAERLREIYDNRQEALRRGAEGRRRVAEELSYEAVGRCLQRRFADIVRRLARGAL